MREFSSTKRSQSQYYKLELKGSMRCSRRGGTYFPEEPPTSVPETDGDLGTWGPGARWGGGGGGGRVG